MKAASRTKRRFLRFNLRTFLLIVLVICIVLGWKFSRARKQYEAVRWVEQTGGRVFYDYQIDDDGRRVAELPALRWLILIELFGMDFFDDIVYVRLGTRSQLSDVKPLAGLPNLEGLVLRGSQVNDLTPLSGMTRLRRLRILETKVSDIAPLARLTNLEQLELRGTQVSQQDVENLKRALPKCNIGHE